MTRVAGIVLAAGESRRMGRSKAAHPWGHSTFLETILETLRGAGLAPLVVVTSDRPPIDPPEIPETVRRAATEGTTGTAGTTRLIVNGDWRLGQFSSLRAGIVALPAEVDAALVALVDQPHLTGDLVRSLVDTFVTTRAPLVRPVWSGRGGHPILLGAETFQEIAGESPDAHTAQVIGKFRALGRDVPAPDDSVLLDFDTPADLARHLNPLASPRNDAAR